jgi:urease accessory protein UreF
VAIWTDLGASPNPFRVEALVELAKHYEHREKDLARALETTRAALALEDTAELRAREHRLGRRQSKGRPKVKISRSTAKSR